MVELLGVGPQFLPSETPEEKRRIVFDGFRRAPERSGFLETVRVLLALASHGHFPLNPDRHCTWCDYEQACRRSHPPTLEREAHARDSADYRDLKKKTRTGKPTLADVRGHRTAASPRETA